MRKKIIDWMDWCERSRMGMYANDDIKYLILAYDYSDYGYQHIGTRGWIKHHHNPEHNDRFRDRIL